MGFQESRFGQGQPGKWFKNKTKTDTHSFIDPDKRDVRAEGARFGSRHSGLTDRSFAERSVSKRILSLMRSDSGRFIKSQCEFRKNDFL